MRGALSVFAVTAVVLALLLQPIVYGDGILYLELARAGTLYAHHHLYLPLLVPFTRAAELAGISDRTAGFLFSAVSIAAGNAFLWLALARHVERPAERALLVALASSAPVALFFGTTCENHAQHYAWVCLALWLIDRAPGRRPFVVGLAVACVPASHLTGFMLVPALVLLFWLRAGTRATAALLVPLAVYVYLFHVATWFRSGVLHLEPELLASPIGFQGHQLDVAGLARRAPGFVWNAWLAPAFGVWTAFLFALRKQADRTWIAASAVAIAPYAVLLPMQGLTERGAYFLPLLPIAVLTIARGAWSRPLVAGLVVAQAALGILALSDYPRTDLPEDANGFAQLWADDAMRVDAGVEASKRFYFCDSLWRERELRYDHGAGSLYVALFVQKHRATLPLFFATLRAELPEYDSVWITEELWAELPTLWPELRASFTRDGEPHLVTAGRFRGRKVK